MDATLTEDTVNTNHPHVAATGIATAAASTPDRASIVKRQNRLLWVYQSLFQTVFGMLPSRAMTNEYSTTIVQVRNAEFGCM